MTEKAAHPRALLFDMDGTMLDSDPIHIGVFADMMRPFGIEVDHAFYNAHVLGGRNDEIFAKFLPDEDPHAMDRAKEAEYRRRIASMHLTPTDGLVALLDRAAGAGVPCVVATNACQENLDAVIDALGLRDRFAALLSADHCARGKPHPEVYERAAALAGFDPASCVAFEDSASGIKSAAGAGCRVVGITTSLAPAALTAAGANTVAKDFNDPSLAGVLGDLFVPA